MKEIKKDQPKEQTKQPKQAKPEITKVLDNQQGKIGYIIAWMMGVPASVLLFIFLLRGH